MQAYATIKKRRLPDMKLSGKCELKIPEDKDRLPLRVSIITVCYNSASTISDTLESIKNQDYKNIEHIIVDGSSQDGTMDIVRSYAHISKWISERDTGLYEAMNKGLNMATGDIIGILNSDDVYASDNVISKIVACFANPEYESVYGDIAYVNNNNMQKVVRYWKSGIFKPDNFYFGWMPPHPTFFVKKEVYEKVGKFNLLLKSSADYEIMLRILFKYHFRACYLPEILVNMRAGGLSNSSLLNRLRANYEDRKAWKLNHLHPYFFTLFLKPIRKIFQFL